MNAHPILPTDAAGLPYTPAKARPWLSEALRADMARQLDCPPAEVEYRLDAREQMDRFIEARVDYERGARECDISLRQLELEAAEGRIGDQLIHRIHPTSEQKAHLEEAVAVLRGTHVGERV